MSELKKLALHDFHVAAGARFAPFAGYEMPVRYKAIKEEHHAVRRLAGLFDVSHMGEIFIRGPEAIAALDALVTNDLSRLDDGKALYTLLCREDGGILDDIIIYRLSAEELLICANASNRQKDFDWIKAHLQGDAEAVDESDSWSQLAIQGPEALGIVSQVFGEDVSTIGPFRVRGISFQGEEVLVARTGYTGEDGFELYAPNAVITPLFEACVAAGEPVGMELCGLGARDTLRLEARLLLYGNDLDEETNAYEAGLGWVVKLDAAPFIGRDALAAVKAAGPARHLRGVTLEARGVLRSGYTVWHGDQQVGILSSGGVAPTLDDRSIGLAYIDNGFEGLSELEVEIRGKRLPIRLTRDPFYRRPQ